MVDIVPYRVLLATPDIGVGRDFAALALEAGDMELAGTVTTAGALIAALGAAAPDVIVLHESLGPLPVLDLARDLAGRVPEVGVVLLAREPASTPPVAALRAGFRGIIGLPISLEDLATTVADAGAWSQAVRAKFERDDLGEDAGPGGRMLAIAGGKGGVGTTTLAVHLALHAVQASPPRTVCLVDFDLQKGDVRSLLDLTHRRSVSDLVDIADDLTGRQIEESLYVHSSGLRVLLPPSEGEYAEAISAEAARRILAGIRTRFDMVIVDLGSVVTEGSAVAAEIADQVMVVVTPDVLCLRAANRLFGLWARLQVRKEGIGVLVNRSSRDSEIQPELIEKVLGAPVLNTSVPADFRSLEAAANTGVPDRLEEGRVRRALVQLAEELRLVQPRRARPLGMRSSQSGQVTVDFVGMLPIAGIVLVLLWELVLAGYTTVLTHHAAREAARELAVSELQGDALDNQLEQIVRSDLPRGWDVDGVDVRAQDDRVRVSVPVPILLPGRASPLRINTEAGTVREVGWTP